MQGDPQDPQSILEGVQAHSLVPPSSPGAKLADEVNLKRTIKPYWFAIPAAFDMTASSLMFVGLTQCAASVY